MRSVIPFKNQILSIVPFGAIDKEILNSLQTELTQILGFVTRILREEPVPGFAFDPKRNQYHSTKILERLKKIKRSDERILGIANVDLYVPGLNFVFGEADTVSEVCIISLIRLRQEYYSLPKNEKLFLERVLKEAIHEIGHTYRLGHCEDPKCIMHFSNSIRDTDVKGPLFCRKCMTKVIIK